MDILKNKQYPSVDYLSRYISVPFYYNTVDGREMCGVGHNMRKDMDYVSHKVIQGDSLDKLALNYYNNPTLWWLIAYFNDIQDSLIELQDYYSVIKVPRLTNIIFEDSR